MEKSKKVKLIRDRTKVRALPIEWLVPTEPLLGQVFVRVSRSYVPLREAGALLMERRINRLVEADLDVVYFHEQDWPVFLEKCSKLLLKSSKKGDRQAAFNIRNMMYAIFSGADASGELSKQDYEKVVDLSERLYEVCAGDVSMYLELVQRFRSPELYQVSHSLNVAILSLVMGTRGNLNELQKKELLLAGLFHNIGNLTVSKEILEKADTLTDAEKKQVQWHVREGGAFLRLMNAPESVVLTAEQHHERLDGEGYPNCVSEQEIHPFARICSVADVLDALLSSRFNARTPLNKTQAMDVIQHLSQKLDGRLLKEVA